MYNVDFNLIIAEDYEEVSKRCAQIMLDCVMQKPNAVICLATGHSPLGAYRLFVEDVKKNQVDLSEVVFVKLDEWYGLDIDDPATCEHYISNEILKPLGIPRSNYIGFNSEASDPEAECIRIANELEKRGPIDLIILGIGKNGHLGLNEPANRLLDLPHVAALDNKTKGHQMLEQTSKCVEYGLTLGMKDIMRSEQIVFLVTGSEKRDAFREFIEAGITTQTPATIIKLHKNLSCIVEKSIAQ